MLKSIFIRNFALLTEAEIDLEPGFTVFTGETGAGKSILVGALSQLLGDRAAVKSIRHGADKAELVACFDLQQQPAAKKWLTEQEFPLEDNELVIRRVIRQDGKSRLWINQTPTTAGAVRQLAALLVQIHGQHDHMRLTRPQEQKRLLDESGQYDELLQAVKAAASQWQETESALNRLQASGAISEEQAQLLRYQLEELEDLALEDNELENLHQEQRRLSHAVDLILTVENAIDDLLESDHAIDGRLGQIISQLKTAAGMDFSSVAKTLEEALIAVEEAAADLRHLRGGLKTDPERLQAIENRLDAIHQMARKHKVAPEMLAEHHRHIAEMLISNSRLAEKQEQLTEELQRRQQAYREAAAKLTQARRQAAVKLAAAVESEIHKLGLPDARVAIDVKPEEASKPLAEGVDQVQFCIATNPGQPLAPLKDTASGGELSRIALAIEVQRHQQSAEPMTFVFDEVDTGVGGAVAEKVGQLLRTLASRHQVLAVTHLPQVAGQAQHHIKIMKTTDGTNTESRWQPLDKSDRINELARMTGGEKITEATLSQAREFLVD
jgi:DNA repair protein RecN (Recombination protein N)